MKRWLRRLAALLGGSLALLVLALTVAPLSGLYATYTVMSDSMAPAIPMGSVAIVVPADPASLRVGDVISYTSSQPPYPTLTHRIQSIQRQGGRLTFKTKGDANLVPDPWTVHYRDQAGLVFISVPLLGYALEASGRGEARAALGLLLAALLAMLWLRAVWGRSRRARSELPPPPTPARNRLPAALAPPAPAGVQLSVVRLAIIGWLIVGVLTNASRRVVR